MNNKIIIETKNGKFSLQVEGNMSWPDACLLLFSALRTLANQTVDAVLDQLNPPKKSRASIRDDIAGDVADMINFAASNVLEELSPHDPSLTLSEIAIATMENEIIHKAEAEGKTLQEALEEYQTQLINSSKHPAKPASEKTLTALKCLS